MKYTMDEIKNILIEYDSNYQDINEYYLMDFIILQDMIDVDLKENINKLPKYIEYLYYKKEQLSLQTFYKINFGAQQPSLIVLRMFDRMNDVLGDYKYNIVFDTNTYVYNSIDYDGKDYDGNKFEQLLNTRKVYRKN